jgi:hypothetical protein
MRRIDLEDYCFLHCSLQSGPDMVDIYIILVLIATGRFQHTFRNSVMYFYGYGFIIYPELYNSWFRIARVHLPP